MLSRIIYKCNSKCIQIHKKENVSPKELETFVGHKQHEPSNVVTDPNMTMGEVS